MKVSIEEDAQYQDVEVIIKCAHINPSITKLIARLQSDQYTLKGEKHGHYYSLTLEDIHYFESVDDQTFIYTKDDVYQSNQKLYELEEQLRFTHCVRISKSCIVNCACLEYVKPLFDGKFEAKTIRGEVLIINRHYVKMFKEVFGL